jgi:anion-transporting  ArsA/GET3 family ATPase
VAPPPRHLLDRKLVFVTGKGGVGKTTIAAALAAHASHQGKRVLVCEVDAKGNLADFFESKPMRWEPQEVAPGLFAMAMQTEESLKEYLKLQLKLPLLARVGPLARSLDFVATAAPGVKEILTVGKLCYEVREQHYDLVVVDAAATGHVVAQLGAPEAIGELVKVGIVQDQTRWMHEILADPSATGAVIVSAPEEMPVSETLELAERLQRETSVDLAAVVVNKVLPELFGRREEEIFRGLREPVATAALAEAVGGGNAGTAVTAVLDGAELAVTLRRSRAEHLTRLRTELPTTVPLLYVPYLFARLHGIRTTNAVAEALGEEL